MDTHIFIADSESATLYINKGPKDALTQKSEKDFDFKQGDADIQQGQTDTKSTSFNVLQSYEKPTSEEEKQREEIARDMCEMLHMQHKNMRRLIVVAPPQMLGELRKYYSHQVKDLIETEVDKNLTNFSVNELPDHLEEYIAIKTSDDFDRERAKQFTAT